MEQKEKRKTFTSNEVKKRYADKTYQQYAIKLRKVEDKEIIDLIEAERAKGIPTSQAFKNLLSKINHI